MEMKKWEGNRWNGRLHGLTRNSVTEDMDVLLQQRYLALDSHELVAFLGKVYPLIPQKEQASNAHHPLHGEYDGVEQNGRLPPITAH